MVVCEICGYTWKKGTDGCHSCVQELNKKVSKIQKDVKKIKKLINLQHASGM